MNKFNPSKPSGQTRNCGATTKQTTRCHNQSVRFKSLGLMLMLFLLANCTIIYDAVGSTKELCAKVDLKESNCSLQIDVWFDNKGRIGKFRGKAPGQSLTNSTFVTTNTATGVVVKMDNSSTHWVTFVDSGIYESCITTDILDADGTFVCTTTACETTTVTFPNRKYGIDVQVNGSTANYNLVELNGGPMPPEMEWEYYAGSSTGFMVVGNDPTLSFTFPTFGYQEMRMNYHFPGTNNYGVLILYVENDDPSTLNCRVPIYISQDFYTADLSFKPPANTIVSNVEWLVYIGTSDTMNTNPASFDLSPYTRYYLELGADLLYDDGSTCMVQEFFRLNSDCSSGIDHSVNNDSVTLDVVIFDRPNAEMDSVKWKITGPDGQETYAQYTPFSFTYAAPGTYTVCQSNGISELGVACVSATCKDIFLDALACTDTDCVFPGDADYDQIANNFDLLAVGLEYGETGPPRPSATLVWEGQTAADWSSSQASGINNKHVDCNGDGLVDENDLDAINANYNRTHNGVDPTNLVAGSGIYLDFELDTIILDPSDPSSFVVNAYIMGGTATDPAEDIYGLAFTMNYSSELVEEDSTKMIYDDNSWLGTELETIDLDVDFYVQGELDLGFSRTDQIAASGFGRIATVQFVVTDNIIGKSLGEIPFNVSISDLRVVDAQGQVLPFGTLGATTLLQFDDEETAIKLFEDTAFELFPNPTSSTLQVELPRAEKHQISLYNTLGQVVFQAQSTEKISSIDIENLTTGIYFLQVSTDAGELTKKVVVK